MSVEWSAEYFWNIFHSAQLSGFDGYLHMTNSCCLAWKFRFQDVDGTSREKVPLNVRENEMFRQCAFVTSNNLCSPVWFSWYRLSDWRNYSHSYYVERFLPLLVSSFKPTHDLLLYNFVYSMSDEWAPKQIPKILEGSLRSQVVPLSPITNSCSPVRLLSF